MEKEKINQIENNLSFGDYKNIRSRFCFLDESGSLGDKNNPFFTIGIIRCSQPYYIQQKIKSLRDKKLFFDEMKFNKLSKLNFEFACDAVKIFLDTESVFFSSYTLDKEGNYFRKTFGENPWEAYEKISIRLLNSNIHDNEILIVIADYITTPKGVKYEVNVKRLVNEEKKRLALAGVCRIDSKANDLLQLVDLFIGAVNYDLKLTTGLTLKGDTHKRRFTQHFKQCLGAKDFLSGFKNFRCNIFVDKDTQQRLPLLLVNQSKLAS